MLRMFCCKPSHSPLPPRIKVLGWWAVLSVAMPAAGALAQEPAATAPAPTPDVESTAAAAQVSARSRVWSCDMDGPFSVVPEQRRTGSRGYAGLSGARPGLGSLRG